jgi:hypothetical protein
VQVSFTCSVCLFFSSSGDTCRQQSGGRFNLNLYYKPGQNCELKWTGARTCIDRYRKSVKRSNKIRKNEFFLFSFSPFALFLTGPSLMLRVYFRGARYNAKWVTKMRKSYLLYIPNNFVLVALFHLFSFFCFRLLLTRWLLCSSCCELLRKKGCSLFLCRVVYRLAFSSSCSSLGLELFSVECARLD